MVKSMTGYGRAREMRSGRDITVEVRSVNNRYLDCTVKLPRAYIFAEDAIKTRVQKAISRGKVDVFVTIDTSAADVAVVQVNEGLAKGYYDALTLLKERFTLPGEITPEVLARFPDVLTVTKAEEDVEAIAADTGCSIVFLHHASKGATMMGAGDQQQASRGSSVLVDNIRWQSYLSGMTAAEAEEWGVDDSQRPYFVRYGVSKANYGAPFKDRWFRRHDGGVLKPAVLEKQRKSKGVRRGEA